MLASISNDMENFNQVATITKQNEKYQPYIISVFQGKELEKLGVSNLKGALELVPGIDMATDNFNNQTPIFRGSNSLAYGQTKLFIDNVVVNNLFFDAYSEYLGMPIEMIKRIEVVRGPGSKTNGVNAYAGSINVITYAEDFKGFESSDELVFKYGSYDYRMAGFLKTFKQDDLKVFIDFYYQQDDKKLPAGIDGYSQGSMSITGLYDNTGLAQTGDAPVWLKDYSLSVNLTYKDFTLKARALDHSQGSAYGINLSLPEHYDRLKLPSYYLDLGYDKNIDDYEVDIKAGVKYGSFDSKAKLAPDGLQFMDYEQYLNGGGITNVSFPNGIYGEHLAVQRTLYQSSYVKYNGIDRHVITTGYRLIKEETIDMVSKLSNWTTGDAALVDYTTRLPFFDKDAKRDIEIFSLQDEFQYSDDLSFIYGFNYEQTSYKDAGFEPRISMVYQQDPQNIYKAIYSRAHRNPSWQEMFTMNNAARVGSTDLEPEKVDAFEAAYIRKLSSDSYLQTNLFYLLNKNQIYNTATDPIYRNVLDTVIYGLEVEYKGNIFPVDTLYLNYSYVTGSSYVKSTGVRDNSLPNISHHLAKGYYIYNLYDNLSLSGVAKYVSSKDRVSTDTRNKVPAYATLDGTLSYKNLKYDYKLMLSVKNIFDAKVIYASPINTYVDDYVQERRNFIITLMKEF
ncbi:TonB-dependent receptor plug domain-containing protein [bacterium]|nr:TonB-dependent receptor plug domain-containing protein [bacterium]MBU1883255.1 TonB-dependent receptor plug domain-containing protein [bacterium]